ncbi:hypothetical protein EDD37DRAFT_649659 [Exophiala viscosa]|uniref:uncharacterized protein n=1 Tax=Exophiala viscosa TaxID=2486360 RepID=UPI00219C0BB5|nr:hypothetical protein EDD37DRAFT_649659 [Exophiala viscosa]
MLQNEVQAREVEPDATETHSTPQSWREFIEEEAFCRVYFCAYILVQTISEVFGTPVPINLTDCALPLPCSEAEWAAPSEESWQALSLSSSRVPTPDFRMALAATISGLAGLSSDGVEFDQISGLTFTNYSSLGGQVLVLSIFMHSYHLSVTKRSENPRVTFQADEVVVGRIPDTRAPSAFKGQFPSSSQIENLRMALSRWKLGWRQNPEALMSPTNPMGPVSFNSTAHYRVTNLRLFSDFSSIRRALRTQDPRRVFQAMAGISGSPIQRTDDVTDATFSTIAAIQIPIRMGVRLFAHTACLTWSLEHFLTGFECALFLAYWLLSLERDPCSMLSEHEAETRKLVATLVDESGEDVIRSPDGREILSVSVLRIWASIFDHSWVWGITKTMGTSLGLFADHVSRAVMSSP